MIDAEKEEEEAEVGELPDDNQICWANWLKEVRIEGESLLEKFRFDFE